MSLLTVMQEATAMLSNIPRPSFIAGNSDPTLAQMLSLANEEGRNLAETHPWQSLTRVVERPAVEGSSGAVAVDQGSLEEIAPGYAYLLGDTLWLEEQPLKLAGPLTVQQRTGIEAYNVAGATWTFWIEGDHLWVSGPASAGQRLRLRYQSRLWVRSIEEGEEVYRDRMVLDADEPLVPERLVILGTCWRWLSANGLPYQQQYLSYQQALNHFKGHEGTQTILNASDSAPYSPARSVVGGVMRV